LKVVDLSTSTSIEQIASFNKKFIFDTRLSDPLFLEWKYRRQSGEGNRITAHYGLLDGTKIIAQISAQRMSAWIDNKWQECDYWGDWFADPEYKGSGFYLLKHVMAQSSSLLACSGSEQAHRIYQRQKFSISPIDNRFVFIARPLNVIFSSLTYPRRAAGLMRRWSKNPFSRVPNPPLTNGYQLAESRELDPNLLTGWELTAPEGTVFVQREPRIFSWILDGFPFPEFRLLVLTSGREQVGYVLIHLRKNSNGLSEGKIVDLFAQGWNKSLLEILFRQGARKLITLGAHIISYHATHPLFISLAVEGGFTKSHNESVILNGPIASAMSSEKSNLHITFYDHDEAYY